jgi:replicative DNA helicase
MSADELSLRMACGHSGVSSLVVRTGQVSSEDASRLSTALNQQSGVDVAIHSPAALTIGGIRREVRRQVRRGARLVVVDYLQLIQPDDRRDSREQQVAKQVRALKQIARENKVAVMCLSQLNRQVDEYEVPKLAHLRESGSIEQDADVVAFLSRHKPEPSDEHNSFLTIAKNRNGATGSIKLVWDGARTSYDCPSTEWNPDRDF